MTYFRGQSHWQSQIIYRLWIGAIWYLSTEGNDEAIKMKSRVMPYLSSSSPGSSPHSRCLNYSAWVVHKYRSILNCKPQMRKRGYRYTHYKTKALLILISPVMNSCTEKNNLQLPLKMLYAFFWVIPRRRNFICRCFGTLSVPSS
jgi:hypothetical protein